MEEVSISIECPICMSPYLDDSKGLQRLQLSCGHSYCVDCVRDCVWTALTSKCLALSCPHCGLEMGVETLLPRLLGESDGDGLKRQVRVVQGWRECPACSEMVEPANHNNTTATSNIMHCPKCSSSFCRAHSNAHPVDMDCDLYERELNATKEERLTAAAMTELGSKPCPNCGIPCEKSMGCDHVKCGGCGAKWCFKCSNLNLVVSRSGLNVLCPKCQSRFLDHDQMWRVRLPLVLLSFLWIPLALVWVVLALAFSLLCCGCLPCLSGKPRPFQRWALIVFFPFLAAMSFFCQMEWVNALLMEEDDT